MVIDLFIKMTHLRFIDKTPLRFRSPLSFMLSSSLVLRLLCVEESGTHCLCMLSSPGFLGIHKTLH